MGPQLGNHFLHVLCRKQIFKNLLFKKNCWARKVEIYMQVSGHSADSTSWKLFAQVVAWGHKRRVKAQSVTIAQSVECGTLYYYWICIFLAAQSVTYYCLSLGTLFCYLVNTKYCAITWSVISSLDDRQQIIFDHWLTIVWGLSGSNNLNGDWPVVMTTLVADFCLKKKTLTIGH
jgi:hypothetical protein